MEIWKNISEIKGMEQYGNYEVSNLGNVKSLKYRRTSKPKLLKPLVNTQGYLLVKLYSNGNQKHFCVHRLVALAFISNPNDYPEVNHIDENKQNNNVTNLEWCDRVYNVNFGSRNKRASEAFKTSKARKRASEARKKKIICIELNEVFNSVSQAAELLNIDQGFISNVLTGRNKTAKGYHFEYYKK